MSEQDLVAPCQSTVRIINRKRKGRLFSYVTQMYRMDNKWLNNFDLFPEIVNLVLFREKSPLSSTKSSERNADQTRRSGENET